MSKRIYFLLPAIFFLVNCFICQTIFAAVITPIQPSQLSLSAIVVKPDSTLTKVLAATSTDASYPPKNVTETNVVVFGTAMITAKVNSADLRVLEKKTGPLFPGGPDGGTRSSCYLTEIVHIPGQTDKVTKHYFYNTGTKIFAFNPKKIYEYRRYGFTCGNRYDIIKINSIGCESGFPGTLGDFRLGKHTKITDETFRSWTGSDLLNLCGYFLGKTECSNFDIIAALKGEQDSLSGEKKDFMEAIKVNQYQCGIDDLRTEPAVNSSFLGKLLTYSERKRPVGIDIGLITVTNNGQPTSPGGYVYNVDNYDPDGSFKNSKCGVTPESNEIWSCTGMSHRLIALNFKELSNKTGADIEVLDPNGPEIYTITCTIAQFNMDSFGGGGFTSGNRWLCKRKDGKDLWNWTSPNGKCSCLSYLTPSIFGESLIRAFEGYCSQKPYPADRVKFCSEREDTSGWLKANYPQIPNTSASFGKGACGGWVNTVLQTTYLGEFVYKCPKGGGGTSALDFPDKNIQLANVIKAINDLIEEIRRGLVN